MSPVTQRDPAYLETLIAFERDPGLESPHQHSQDDIDDRAREAAQGRAYWAARREADWGRL